MKGLFSVIAVFMSATTCATAALMGGFRPVSPRDENVISASRFALGAKAAEDPKYKPALDASSFEILEASQQVVAGINYRLVLQLQPPTVPECERLTFMVWDKFGELRLMDATSARCSE